MRKPFKESKICPHHLDRLALIYIRQSTVQQVERHQESTRLQYGLVDKAYQLGWSKQRILVIDDDLGCSGASIEGRKGFQRMVAEVGMDHVGIVLGIEMSRLARSSSDWYRLLDICAIFSTLLGDMDGIYDPSTYNDRLLLGLKGTMSEAELHILKQRMLEGKRAKARRGELGMQVPMGYIRRLSGETMKDPDEEAQSVIQMIFDLFERKRTIDGVLRNLVKENIRLPKRLTTGLNKGELEWRKPNRITLSNLFHNPAYAGAYAYGRHPTDPKRKIPGRPATGRTVAPMDEWEVLIKDHHPAYISWEQYQRNVQQLQANTAQSQGVVRCGPSLLSGLLICGRCGLRMSTHYSSNATSLRYACYRMRSEYGEPTCQSLMGKPLDDKTSELILQAMEPAALEISLKVAEDVAAERERHMVHWKKRLERAAIDVQRAERQYQLVEPENRLVARTLEKQWEATLLNEEKLQQEYERFLQQEPTPLSAADRKIIRQLAKDIPSIWSSQEISNTERQNIVRLLLDRVIVTVMGDTEKVNVEYHWAGGHRTRVQIIRPVARLEQLSYYPQLLERVKSLHGKKQVPQQIAKQLNQEGWQPPKRRKTFNRTMVISLLERQGIQNGSEQQQPTYQIQLHENEWTIKALAQELHMPTVTLFNWMKQGKVIAKQQRIAKRMMWIIDADSAEIARLKTLRSAPRIWLKKPNTDPKSAESIEK